MPTTTDPTAAHVRLVQIATEAWPVHLATGGGWCGPGTLFLSRRGGPIGVSLEDWGVGLAVGQRVLLVARSWETNVEFFTTVRRCTEDGRLVVSWPEQLEIGLPLSSSRPETSPGEDRRAA